MTEGSTWVFAYGSLLDPDSLASTLPDIDPARCVPARLPGHGRRFGVAFPNNGREADKAYYDDVGDRPSFVLFCDLVSRDGVTTNGLCIPVDSTQLAALRRRELRYDLVDLLGIEPYPGFGLAAGSRVVAFVGKAEFTCAEHVRAGVVARSYRDETVRGATFWDSRAPGFLADFDRGTEHSGAAVVDLRRVDA